LTVECRPRILVDFISKAQDFPVDAQIEPWDRRATKLAMSTRTFRH